jgi:DNA polymerase-1
MNIPIFEQKGFEADDVIGTLAAKISQEKDIEVYIATGDMDALQLVDKQVKVYAFKKGISETVIYDEAKVEEKYGITPKQIVDFKGLRGDASDNIPGVKGIGEKGAVALLQEFGDITNLYDRIRKGKGVESIKPGVLVKLGEQKDRAFMSRDLATIRRDMDIDFRLDDCRWGDYNREKVLEIFRRFEFFSLILRLGESEEHVEFREPEQMEACKKEKIACHVVKSEKDLNGLIDKIKQSSGFVLKTM